MPITRDTLNHVIESVVPKSVPAMSIEIAASALPAGQYAFDLVHYDAEKKRLLMLSMVYGAGFTNSRTPFSVICGQPLR